MTNQPSTPDQPPPVPGPPRRRWLRWGLRVLLGLVLLLVVAVLGLLAWVQTPSGSRGLLALGLQAANEAIAGRLTVRSAEISGGTIVLRDVTLEDPDGERVAHLDLLEARLALLPLIGNTVHLKAVRVEHPELWLTLDESGTNLARAVAPRHPSPPGQTSGPLPLTFVVDGLALERGAVRLTRHEDKEVQHLLLGGLQLRGAGRYAGPTGTFEVHADGQGTVSGLLDGALQLTARGKGEGRAREGAVDLGLAGLVVRGSVVQGEGTVQARLERLVVPPAVGRALTSAWTPRVPVELSGEGALEGNRARVELRGRAGTAQLALQARGDPRAATVEQGHLELRHVDLAQLLADGPPTDVALIADARGSGRSLETMTGAVDLSVPPSQVRKATVGPVELHATTNRGALDLRELRAVLPGLRVSGSGKGTTRDIHASLDAEAQDLALLGRTFGGLSAARLPPLAGSGTLHVEASGPLRHPGLRVQGNFPALRINDVRVRALRLSADVPDVDRPLDANAQLEAQELRLGERAIHPVSFSLLTRGRALDLHAATGGSLPMEVHVGGTVDEDRHGIEMEMLTLRYPEASWSMEAPAHLSFGGETLELAPLRLVAGEQVIRLGGWKRGDRVDATVGLEALDLARLPKALLPPSMPLAGRVTLEARAQGPVADPALEATVDAADVTAGKVQNLFVKGNGAWANRRAQVKVEARALGTSLSADVDLPVDALRKRRHEPVRAQVAVPAFDVAQVICTAVRMKLFEEGCAEGKAEATGTAELQLDLSGFADAPVLHASARTHGVRYRQLPPADLTLAVDGPERGNLSAAAKGTVLQGTVDVQASVGRSLARLVSDARPLETLLTAELQARARIGGVQLKPLHEAELVSRDLEGAVSLSADLAGTVGAPSGDLRLEAHQLRTAPMDPTDLSLEVKAQKTITAVLDAKDANAPLASLSLAVSASPASLQARRSYDDVPVTLEGKFGPLELSRLPVVFGEGRQARRLRGTLLASVHGRGSLQAPTLTAEAHTEQLGAGETPLGKADLTLDYQQARSRLHAALASVNGGTLRLDGSVDLDLSWPALRKGPGTDRAPFQLTAQGRNFDVAFLTGFTTTLRRVAGTLDVDARASGTLGQPEGEGRLELKDGMVGLAGYGQYQKIHLLLDASNDRVSIDDLQLRTEAGSLKVTALGTRGGALWTLKGNAEASSFPVFTDDQQVATVSLRADLDGTARKGAIELSKIHIPEAHVELPTQSRKDLQSLHRPDDIILLRNGKPLDLRRAREILARDRTLDPALAGTAFEEPPPRTTQLVLVLDAPKNLWVKAQDLNVEVGLSQDFRVEIGEATDLFGEVRILRGRLDVLGRRFDFQKNSVVRFSGLASKPALNVTAIYNNAKAGVKVSMHVQGQAGEIQLVPTSEPPLTESEIYTLLATGRTTLKRGSGGSEIGSAQAVSVLGSLAAAQLKTAVSDKVGLDVLSIEAGDEGLLQGATLEAGKYITDDLYLGYAGKVGADPTRYENANAFRLEYQFLPRWSFEAVYGDAKSGSADIVWTRDY